MNIIIISKNTYPIQGPRAFRTAELSEELARKGHKVIVYVAQNNFDYSEYSSRTGVEVKKIPLTWQFEGKNKIQQLFMRFLIKFLKKPLEFPEIELMYKIPKVLKNIDKPDLIISIGYPHTIHWGVQRFYNKSRRLFSECWISDCGDPFMLNPLYHPPFYFAKFEKRWCEATDFITVPTPASIDGYYPEFRNKIRVVPQGFDFNKTPISEYVKNQTPTFLFAGSIYPGVRDPYKFMDYLGGLECDFKFIMYTRSGVPPKYRDLLRNKLEIISDKGRKDVIKAASEADFLINVVNPSTVQTPSKLIDYALAKRPILNISTDFKEETLFGQFIEGDYSGALVVENIEDYRIENVADSFIKLYESKVQSNNE